MRPPEMRPSPRVAATSDTNCPSAVLMPPAPLVKVTSLEKAISSSTCPQVVQHLQRGEECGQTAAMQDKRKHLTFGTINHQQYTIWKGTHEKPFCSSRSTSTSALQLVQNTMALGLAPLCLRTMSPII